MFRERGALLVPCANMSEIGLSVQGYNNVSGQCRNPHNLGHVSGGSSSGCASAVAAGLFPVSLGCVPPGATRLNRALRAAIPCAWERLSGWAHTARHCRWPQGRRWRIHPPSIQPLRRRGPQDHALPRSGRGRRLRALPLRERAWCEGGGDVLLFRLQRCARLLRAITCAFRTCGHEALARRPQAPSAHRQLTASQ